MTSGRIRRAPPPVTVIATVGPAVFAGARLRALGRLGRLIFRVNGAHGDAAGIAATIRRIRRAVPQAAVLLDLPGRKLRVTGLAAPLSLRRGRPLQLHREQFSQPRAFDVVKRGQVIITNDGRSRLEVAARTRSLMTLMPQNDGVLANNKGIHIGAALAELPLFGEKDLELLRRLEDWPVSHVGVSFVCTPEDIDLAARRLRRSRPRAQLVPKIETAAALANLEEILAVSETVLLDRGDLASEIGLEALPDAQERLIQATTAARVQLIVATQLLKTMEANPIPFIAELTEIHRLLARGVFGLQLSEETATGKHPVECVKLIMSMAERLVVRRRRIGD